MPKHAAALATLVLLAAGPCLAATTSRLAGAVVDNQGSPLAGVTVEISSDALIGGPQSAVTDADGGFAFDLLPVGEYTVAAMLAGFLPASGQLRVRLGRVAAITVHMAPESFTGEVLVRAEAPVVDVSQVDTSLVLGRDFLQAAAVGTEGRSVSHVLSRAPGVTGGLVYGSTNGDNAFLVDGIDVTDPFDGTSSFELGFDAIEELSVATGGFEAEFGRAIGGVVNLVTRAGGNEYSGSFDLRYRDEGFIESGDHFDPEAQESRDRSLSGTLGGPVLRDRLWFFAAAENRASSLQHQGTHFPREEDTWSLLAKATWQTTPDHRAVLKYSGFPSEVQGTNSSPLVQPSASETQDDETSILQAELASVLSGSLLLTARLGLTEIAIDVDPSHGRERSRHINQNTLVWSNSNWEVQRLRRDRDQLGADLSWYLDLPGGSHELKAGAELHQLRDSMQWWFTGGANIFDLSEPPGADWVDLNGDGYFNDWVLTKEPPQTVLDPVVSDGEVLSAFVQDAWRPRPGLTVKAGIRLDEVRLENEAGRRVASMDRWQPRLGVAWDVLGNARHVLRASAGRFMDPTSLYLPGIASGAPWTVGIFVTLEYLCNTERLCDPSDAAPDYGEPLFWISGDGLEYVLFDIGIGPQSPLLTVDELGVGRLRAPYADELVLAYETRIASEASLELSYVHKRTRSLIDDTCINNQWAWGAAPEPNLDDPSTWTTYEECTDLVFANVPGMRRAYDAYILRLEARRERFHVLASYTLSDSRGNVQSGPSDYAPSGFDYYPLRFFNHYGKMPDHRRHRLKLNGFLRLPYNLTLALDGFWSSAGHQTVQSTCGAFADAFENPNAVQQMSELGIDPTLLEICSDGAGYFFGDKPIYLRPRGDLETKSTWQVHVQLAKGFRIRGLHLQAMLALHNLFDRELDLTFNDRAFLQATDANGNPVFDQDGNAVLVPVGAPTGYREPRRYELGLRIEF